MILSGCSGKCFDSFGTETHFYFLPIVQRDAFRLKIDLKRSFRSGIGMASGITRLRFSSGHLAHTTHRILFNVD